MFEAIQLAESWIEDPDREFNIGRNQLYRLYKGGMICEHEFDASIHYLVHCYREAQTIREFQRELGLR